jgi:Na+/proline symporter
MGAISSYMAMISCFVFIAYAQIGYEDGLVGVTVFWSTAFAILVGTFVFARRWQRANLATPVEYLERRYGPGVRQVVSWAGVAFRILDNTVRLYTLGVIASQFLGVSLATGIMLGALLVLAYTLTGGLWSVLVTDIIQCAALMAVALTILPISLNAVGGLGALYRAVPEHFSLFNGHRGTLWFLAAYYLIVFIKYNGSWSFVQRLASVPNERDAVKMGLLSSAIFFAFPILAVLPAVVAVVIAMVNGNVGAGVAVAGAFSLVRFRSAPGSARDIVFIFLAMCVGLVAGMGYVVCAAVVCAVLCVVLVAYQTITFGPMGESSDRSLRITVPEDLDFSDLFDDVLDRYTSYQELVTVKTTNMGSLFKLRYEVIFNSTSDEKKLIDDMRTRNGNLEIMCSRLADDPSQTL